MIEMREISRWCGRPRAGFACFLLGTLAQVAQATTVVPPEFDILVNESDYIVHATTKSVRSEIRSTSRGEKIFTFVEFDILEVVAGQPPMTLTLRFLGGRVGDESLSVGGMPQFRVGDEDILFVRGNGQSICPLYGMMHGRYAIMGDEAGSGKYVARSDGTPLQRPEQTAAPLESVATDPGRRRAAAAAALAPADFVRHIKAAVHPGARVDREK